MKLSLLAEEKVKKILTESLSSPFVFFETTFFNHKEKRALLFKDFIKIITFYPGDDIGSFFEELEENLRRGCWLCGYFSYEFAYFLEQAFFPFCKNLNLNYPLAWIGVCRNPQFLTCSVASSFKEKELAYRITDLKPNITFDEYKWALKKIKYYLEAGDTYQVNFTFKLKFNFSGDIRDFYLNLRRTQPTRYMGFITTGKDYFLTFSPELFFRVEKRVITTRPMKGTVKRGRFLEEDLKIISQFQKDEKIKAENVMIVDLLRNDLGRIAKKGTVIVNDLFRVEKYPTLFQMTSTVTATLRDKLSLKNIFSSLFPSGSVTGAPKIRTMQIIRELEKEERGIYTGAIGYISPQKMAFNIPIRTLHLSANQGEMGIGGGIVYDSLDKNEYEEAFLKANFLIKKKPTFSLIETIRWENGYYLLDMHLKRLEASSRYFDIPFNREEVKEKLFQLEQWLRKDNVYKVRLLLSEQGKISLEYSLLEALSYPLKAVISTKRVNSKDIYLYHKTTNRNLYDEELRKAKAKGFFEVLFLNEKEELTEGSFTNIFILLEGKLYTPPVECGLLRGVLREFLIKEGKVFPRVLTLKEVTGAEKVFLGNSVRGLIEAEIYRYHRVGDNFGFPTPFLLKK